MSFIKHPGQFIGHNGQSVEHLFVGQGDDAGYYAFRFGGKWIISKQIVPDLEAAGAYHPVVTNLNGYCYWEGGRNIFYSVGFGWVYIDGDAGKEPIEYIDEEGDWQGDLFWKGNLPELSPGKSSNFSPRGQSRDKRSDVAVTVKWERWISDTQFGEYSPDGGASGKRYFGSPFWKISGVNNFRSVTKKDGHFTYGKIHYSKGKWVIGEIDSDSGWWEGNEPQIERDVTFHFTKKDGPEITGDDIRVSWGGWGVGDEPERMYATEVCVWK